MSKTYNFNQVAIRLVGQQTLLSEKRVITPQAAIEVVSKYLEDRDREVLCVINLGADMSPLNMNIVSIGTVNEAMVHPREIMKSAVLSNASSIILVHNHPSGSLKPSDADISVTSRMQRAGALLGIPVMDHVITGKNGAYYSLYENDLLEDMSSCNIERIVAEGDRYGCI